MTKMALNVPPGRKGFLIELRESIAYLMDGDKFIKDRTAEFGPIFSTTLFFRPTVVVGGQQNVAEFLQVEQSVVESSLPLPLQALMTPPSTTSPTTLWSSWASPTQTPTMRPPCWPMLSR